MEEIDIPRGVLSIGKNAFDGCKALLRATLPDSLQTLDDMAFQNCQKLTEIAVPGGVRSVGTNAFYSCQRIKSLTLGEGVQYIGSSAFYGCTGLADIRLPSTLVSVGTNAFYGRGTSVAAVRYAGTEATWKLITFYSGNDKVSNPSGGVLYETSPSSPCLIQLTDASGNSVSHIWEVAGKTAHVLAAPRSAGTGRKAVLASYDRYGRLLAAEVWALSDGAMDLGSAHAVPVPAGTASLRLVTLNGDGTPMGASKAWW